MRVFFIVGCSRSGTTLLQQLLNRHPRVLIPPETGFFSDVVDRGLRRQRMQLSRLATDLGIEVPRPPRRLVDDLELRSLFERILADHAARVGRSPVVFGEKTPRHLFDLSRILRLFPDARILLMVRDGRAVASSLRRVPWASGDLYVSFAQWLRAAEAGENEVERLGSALQVVRYEELLDGPEAVLRSVVEHLGISYEAGMLEGETTARGVPARELAWKSRALAPIERDRAEAWRVELSSSEVRRLEALGGDRLRRLGYPAATGEDAASPAFRLRVAVSRLLWSVWVRGRLVRAMTRPNLP